MFTYMIIIEPTPTPSLSSLKAICKLCPLLPCLCFGLLSTNLSLLPQTERYSSRNFNPVSICRTDGNSKNTSLPVQKYLQQAERAIFFNKHLLYVCKF